MTAPRYLLDAHICRYIANSRQRVPGLDLQDWVD